MKCFGIAAEAEAPTSLDTVALYGPLSETQPARPRKATVLVYPSSNIDRLVALSPPAHAIRYKMLLPLAELPKSVIPSNQPSRTSRRCSIGQPLHSKPSCSASVSDIRLSCAGPALERHDSRRSFFSGALVVTHCLTPFPNRQSVSRQRHCRRL